MTRHTFEPQHMMATKAMHKLGDISRDVPDLCIVNAMEGDNYIGAWVEGFGFIGVKFPKATTRPLTFEEIKRYDGMRLRINSTVLPTPLKIRAGDQGVGSSVHTEGCQHDWSDPVDVHSMPKHCTKCKMWYTDYSPPEELPEKWEIVEDGWAFQTNVWHGILALAAKEGESSGKFLDIEGPTKEAAVLRGMNYILNNPEGEL